MTHSIDEPYPESGSGASTPSTTNPGTTGYGTTTGGGYGTVPGSTTGYGTTTTTTTTVGTGTTGTTGGGQSTTDVAKDEARNVGQTAKEAGTQVASTAADQAKNVAQETQRQARDLVDQGRGQLREQTKAQQQKAGQGLASLAQELRGLADGSSQGAPGPARDLLQQASSKVEEFAHALQHREPADLLDEVRRFARRKPGTFLLGAAVAGIVAGRLTSGVKAAHSDNGSSGPNRSSGYGYTGAETYSTTTYQGSGYPAGQYQGGSNFVDPTPAYTPEPPTTYADPTGAPVPPPPYGTTPPAGSGTTGWDDPARRPGEGI
jgi:hypothetical protein